MIKIALILVSFLLVFSCEDSNKKSNALKKPTKLSSLKDSNSYALGVNQAEMMLNKSKLDTRDFNQKELIKGFKQNLYTSPILDSMCQYSIEDFIGKNGQSLNSDFRFRRCCRVNRFCTDSMRPGQLRTVHRSKYQEQLGSQYCLLHLQ